MGNSTRKRWFATLALGAAALCSLAGAPAAIGAGGVLSHPVSQNPEAVLDYWTPERMRGATPLEGPVSEEGIADRGARPAAAPTDQETFPGADTLYPQRLHGKLFLRIGGVNASCSATLVTAFGQAVILTAGHCLANPGPQIGQVTYSTNLVFVPGYRSGVAPFGVFPATKAITPGPWAFEGDISLDVGAASLGPNPSGVPATALGSRGVTFNRPPNKYRRLSFEVYGYPANPVEFYDGERLILCVAPSIGFEVGTGSPGISPCRQQEGSSGGAWVFDGGLVASIISHGGCRVPSTACTIIAGTYFGDAAFQAWATAAGGVPRGVKKRIKRCKRIKKDGKRQRCKNKAQTFQPVGA
ncbi:MAG: trypsin-like serine peptidase [Solirubrobacterales bacterium]